MYLNSIHPYHYHHQVARVNAAEAKYWSMSQGWRLDDSTNILGFDCGGQQLVLEVGHVDVLHRLTL
jgi:L-galactono-1,4-lactone dehydrogenase